MSKIRHIILPLVLLLTSLVSLAQTEAEMKEDADKLFQNKQYVEATSLYLRLLSLNPRNHEYNYHYGACLLFNSDKKQDAIRYLRFAITSPSIEPEVFFYLGKAYHLNYQFNDAIKEYSSYLTKTGNKGVYAEEAKRNIEMCQNGKKLLSSITEIIVTKKTEIKQDKFFDLYDLSQIGGTFVVSEDYQSKNDKKYGHTPLIHYPAGAQRIFFSSYGDNDQKDIYMVKRLPNNKWGEPQKVMGNVNTAFDEDYPYMHPSGNYLYFSSKGHNSMGGYDVFRARFDEANSTFGVAENIDFAISSPDDDILYVVDKADQNAYFASARQSQDGKIYVYKVKVDRVPIQLAVIKGQFKSDIDPSINKVTIAVTDELTGKEVGVFNTSPDGAYLITFPKGGKYTYKITPNGSEESYEVKVDIPFLKEFKPLKQSMLHEASEDGERIRIVNQFGENVDDAQSIIAQILKNRSNLNVNVNDFDLDALEEQKKAKEVLSEIGLGELSVQEVGQLLNRKSEEIQQSETSNSTENAINSQKLANLERIKEIDEEVNEIMKEMENVPSPEVKYNLIKEAETLIAERKRLVESNEELNNLESELNKEVVSEIDKKSFQETASKVNELLSEGKETEALVIIKQNQETVKKVVQDGGNQHENELISRKKELDEKLLDYNKTEQEIAKEIEQVESQIQILKGQLETEKEKFHQGIKDEIAEKAAELETYEQSQERILNKQTEAANERSAIEDQLEVIRKVDNYSGDEVRDSKINEVAKSIDNTNATTAANYILSTKKQLEEEHPELKNSTGRLSPTGSIIANHNANAESIIDTESSDDVKWDKQLKLNETTIEDLEKRLAELDQLLENDKFNKTLNAEKSQLTSFIEELKEENASLRKKLSGETSGPDVIASTKEEIQKELQPEYDTEVAKIQQDDNLSEEERNVQLNKIDSDYITSIDEALTETNSQLTADPSNEALNERKNTLEEQKQTLNNQIAKRSVKTENPVITTEELIDQIDNSYSQEKEAIAKNDQLSIEEKRYQEQKLDQDFLEDVQNELDKVIKELEQDPSNQQLTERKEKLEQLSAITDASIQERAQLINSEVESLTEEEVAKLAQDKQSELAPKYADAVSKIENSNKSEEEKKEDLIKEEEKLQSTITKEIAKVEKQLASNPTDVEAKKNLKVLNRMEDDSKKRVETLSTVSTPETTVNEADYIADKRASVDQNITQSLTETPTDETALKEQKALLEKYQNQLQEDVANIEKEEEKGWLNKELELVNAKLNEVSNAIANSSTEPNFETNSTIAELRTSLASEEVISKEVPSDEVEKEAYSNELNAYKQRLEDRLETLNAQASSSNIEAEKQLIKDELSILDNKLEEVNATQSSEEIVESDYVNELRNSLAENNPNVLNESPSDIEELKTQLDELTKYEAALKEVKEEKEKEYQSTKSAKTAKEIEILEAEIEKVQAKKRTVSVTIGELERGPVITNKSAEEQELDKLKEKEAEIKEELAENNLSTEEKRELEAQLEDVQSERAEKENRLIENEIESNAKSLNELAESLNDESTGNSSVGKELALTENKVNQLEKEANKEKDPVLKNQLLKEAQSLQEDTEMSVKTAIVEEKTASIENEIGTSLSSKEELEEQKRKATVSIGELTQDLNAKKAEKENAKRKDQPSIDAEIEVIKAKQNDIRKELTAIDEAIEALPTREPFISENETEATEISYNEERQIAATEEYEAYAREANEAILVENRIQEVEEEIAAEKLKIKQLIDDEVRTGVDHSDEINESKEKIRRGYVTLGELEQSLRKESAEADALLPSNEEESMKMKNLVMRGINPLKKAAIVASLVPLPASGIDIDPSGESTYSASNPIPVGVEQPSGLVYRVQVGAFSRPIPQDLFREFTPVSGEKIGTTGITRYMAGFFNNSSKVVEAREQIRALGYSDAFVVAYCDGKRVTFGEARRMEASGECVPQQSTTMLNEIALKTAKHLGLEDTSKTLKPVPEYTYNQAPGAAKAEPVEVHDGLFFTVQIGVYNHPVGHDVLHYLDPLITMRLPNGQIRYSCDMFDNVKDAQDRKTEIREKVSDAFVTAYYKGERIGWRKGLELLSQYGDTILEDFSKPTIIDNDTATNVTPKIEVPIETVEVFEYVAPEEEEPVYIQIVTKKAFDEYPRDVLNRYNNKGSFYFDEKDRKVKSAIYDSEDRLPRVYFFRDDIDTIYYNQTEVEEVDGHTLLVKLNSETMRGDFTDWLLRFNYRRSIKYGEDGLEMLIFGVKDEALEKVKRELSVFGYEAIIVENRGEEIEEE